jgi:uncharacterized phage-associated protein
MPVEFQLDIDKVIATSIFIASQGVPELTIGKMMKLIFFADKYHLVRYGRPITGDQYDAMNDGPVPSFAYDLFKQILRKPFTPQGRQLASALTIDTNYELPRFSARTEFDPEQLSKSDILALTETIQQFGDKSFEELSAISHAMAAYDKAWRSRGILRKSARMKFEDFFDDDAGAIAGAREETIENDCLKKSFAKR